MNTDQSTIAALSTAPAPSGVAVIRVSGSRCLAITTALFRSKKSLSATPRQAILGTFVDPESGAKIDSCLALFMPGPHSFTGEDVCEFHLHGSTILVRDALRCLYAQGAVPAAPGEFTRRAFMNNKLDLVQAEAIGDIIEATSKEALKIAQGQLDGRLSAIVNEVGEPLRDILAEMEAGIDFPEEDISPDSLLKIATTIDDIEQRIAELVRSYDYGHIVREGFRVLLYGKPNVGKSSLLNHFLGTDRAIVTDISGTTRDILEEQVLLDDYQFVFCDTAGVTDTEDTVEKIGIARAKERIRWADIILYIIDASDPDPAWEAEFRTLTEQCPTLPVVNKIDIAPQFHITAPTAHYIAVQSGTGCDLLRTALINALESRSSDSATASEVVTNERHRDCLCKAQQALLQSSHAVSNALPAEIVSAELRLALSALDELIGKTDTEDILGRIFSKFCIGK